MTDPTPYLASNGNRFSADQAKVITELLRYAPRPETKIRIPARVAEYLGSTQAAHMPESDREIVEVLRLVRARKPRKDGARLLELQSPAQVDALRDYVETMAEAAADAANFSGEDQHDALADLNAARAVLRHLPN